MMNYVYDLDDTTYAYRHLCSKHMPTDNEHCAKMIRAMYL